MHYRSKESYTQFGKLYNYVLIEWRWDSCQRCCRFCMGSNRAEVRQQATNEPSILSAVRHAASTSAVMLAPEAQPAAAGPRVRLS